MTAQVSGQRLGYVLAVGYGGPGAVRRDDAIDLTDVSGRFDGLDEVKSPCPEGAATWPGRCTT